jgi:hypothetical protein
MLATLCSNPSVTNAVMGKTMAMAQLRSSAAALQRCSLNQPVAPGKNDQVVAGKKFGATDNDQKEPKGEGNTTQQTSNAGAKLEQHSQIEHGTEGTGKNGKGEQQHQWQRRFRDTRDRRTLGHPRRGVGIQRGAEGSSVIATFASHAGSVAGLSPIRIDEDQAVRTDRLA